MTLDRCGGGSLRDGFLAQSERQPAATALVVRGEVVTYAILEREARRLAAALIQACGRRPERVGVFAYRSRTAYVAPLAALCAGATFVPLNPTFPREKTRGMIERADLDAIIVDSMCSQQLSEVLPAGAPPLIFPDGMDSLRPGAIDSAALSSIEPLRDLPALTPDDTAYLLFTSGSTGVPKGVPVTHGNAVHFMDVMSRRYEIRPDDRFSQTFDQTFDLSVFDLFMAWSNGASLYAMSPVDLLAPSRFINQNQLTIWFSVPSVPVLMSRRNTLTPNSMPSLRLSLFCGEPLIESSAAAWQLAAPNSVVENLYGPTELTIACLLYRWDSGESPALCRNGVVPIGRPYCGLSAMIVDEKLAPVPEGEPGELCVCGPQTTPGYWRAPEITSERFVYLPVNRQESRRFYRTGDLVVRHASGEYQFVGRADQQLKVLGHRIEMGEVESALRSHPGVEEAVAFGVPVGSLSADHLVAFVLGNYESVQKLIETCRVSLPPYAVPKRIFAVSEMPLNDNRKVNRRALRERLESILEPDKG